jgi:hypothetical protein
MALDDATLPNVIADTGATLRQALRDRVAELAPEGRIIFSSPADTETTTEPRLGLYLYQILEATHLRNDPPEPGDPAAGRREQALELYYLVTPYAQQIEDGHRLLGRVMRTFLDAPVLLGAVLQGSLADVARELRVLLHPLNVEEINKLWGVFPNRAYRLSVAYLVTPVRLYGASGSAAGRVVARDLRYAQFKEEGGEIEKG